ncbi:MAG: phosphoglycerate mutase family protein [Candidatus Aminicenantes bacterium]|nr:phosphoglycerate mutase family protein [Candidatus Aminicenantes bacterium]
MNRKRKRALRALSVAIPIVAIALAAAAGLWAQSQTPETTINLVRHAEKRASPPDDPPLTEAGRARAAELARLLGPLGVTTIFISQYQRTAETARPLAEALGVMPLVVAMTADRSAPGGIAETSIKELVDRILEHKGESILVVGHSNTLPLIIKGLGATPVPDIPDTEYDNLFIVTISLQGEVALARKKF